MLRAHRKTAKPQSSQLLADRAFMHDHTKFGFDRVLQIDPLPTRRFAPSLQDVEDLLAGRGAAGPSGRFAQTSITARIRG